MDFKMGLAERGRVLYFCDDWSVLPVFCALRELVGSEAVNGQLFCRMDMNMEGSDE